MNTEDPEFPCYVAIAASGEIVGATCLESAEGAAKIVLRWLDQGLTVELATTAFARENLFTIPKKKEEQRQ